MPAPTTEADLIEYLDSESDFAFELRILKQLVSYGFECQHGGSYEDPVTGRTRQFDIRGKTLVDHITVHLAVECKNLRPDFPLLVSCIPRVPSESFHEVAVPITRKPTPFVSSVPEYSKIVCLYEDESIYKAGSPVGKSCAQVGRGENGILRANDSEVFEKWSQALASADDLTYDALTVDPGEEDGDLQRIVIFPVLVVSPDNLWVVQFDTDGERLGPPVRTEHISMYVGKTYDHKMIGSFVASHLELLTPAGLASLVSNWFSTAAASQLAPMDSILGKLTE